MRGIEFYEVIMQIFNKHVMSIIDQRHQKGATLIAVLARHPSVFYIWNSISVMRDALIKYSRVIFLVIFKLLKCPVPPRFFTSGFFMFAEWHFLCGLLCKVKSFRSTGIINAF